MKNIEMIRLLIFEPSWLRLRDELAALPSHEAILLGANGLLRTAGQSSEISVVGNPEPDVAWLNNELYLSQRFGQYAGLIARASSLKWVQSATTGTDFPVLQQLLARGVRVSTSHVQASAIAEYVLAKVLGHFQRESERRALQDAQRWQVLPFREILASNWLIVGFGAIGQAVAQRVRAFGGSVIVVRRSQTPHPLADRIVTADDIGDLIPSADVVVVCLPLTTNMPLFGTPLLSKMKEGSIFVNVARGPLVDTSALLAELDAGRIDLAVLDVFETEPLPITSPLWSHPRVAITAHGAAMGLGLAARGDQLFIKNFGRFLRGDVLRWEIMESPPLPAGGF